MSQNSVKLMRRVWWIQESSYMYHSLLGPGHYIMVTRVNAHPAQLSQTIHQLARKFYDDYFFKFVLLSARVRTEEKVQRSMYHYPCCSPQ